VPAVLLALLQLSVALAGTAPPSWMTDGGVTRPPDYPPEQFLCDAGSAEGDRDAARSAAVAGVVRQVRSEVSSRSSLQMSRTTGAGRAASTGTSSSSSSVEVESYFSRSDLIRVVGEARDKRVEYAYACMDRGEAARAVTHDMAGPLARFTGFLEQAQNAWKTKDYAGFTAAYGPAMRAYPEIAVPASIVFTLTSGQSEEARVVGDGVGWLAQTRAAALTGVRFAIAVEPSGLDSTQQKAVADALRASLSNLGFAVGGTCGSGAWAVSAKVDLPTTFTSFGRWSTVPSVSLSLRDCSRTDPPLTTVIADKSLAAMSQEESKARSLAVANISTARLQPALSALLRDIFPIEE
jgi:hypothetical protein